MSIVLKGQYSKSGIFTPCQSLHWQIQGFNHITKNWEIIDDHEGNEMKGYSQLKKFDVLEPKKAYSLFRYLQIGRNERTIEDYHICLRNIELFGYLFSLPFTAYKNDKNQQILVHFTVILLLIIN